MQEEKNIVLLSSEFSLINIITIHQKKTGALSVFFFIFAENYFN